MPTPSTSPVQTVNGHVAQLPSAASALAFVTGDQSALVPVLVHTGGRAMIIALGAAVAGVPKPLRAGIAGALAVEAFVLAWAYMLTHAPPNVATVQGGK